MKNLLSALDPQTYGWNRTPIVLGVFALVVGVVICSKLMAILHAAGLPPVQ